MGVVNICLCFLVVSCCRFDFGELYYGCILIVLVVKLVVIGCIDVSVYVKFLLVLFLINIFFFVG